MANTVAAYVEESEAGQGEKLRQIDYIGNATKRRATQADRGQPGEVVSSGFDGSDDEDDRGEVEASFCIVQGSDDTPSRYVLYVVIGSEAVYQHVEVYGARKTWNALPDVKRLMSSEITILRPCRKDY